jgi:iron(III) transport system substrate-binding protein
MPAAIALFDGENRVQRLIEGARKEGGLTIYAAMPVEDMAALIDPFVKKYGIKVNVWRGGSEDLVNRIATEARAGRFEVDMVQNNAPAMEPLHREKLLQQVNSPTHRDLMAQAIPAHREWVGLYSLIFVQLHNTKSVKKDELPKTYQDLHDSKWKGRLGIEADDQPWFAYVLQELGQEKGTRLFKDIVQSNGISVRKGHTLLANLVASGEVPLSLTVYSYKAVQLKRDGAPVDWFAISPAIAQFTSIALARNAPHPHAAMLFYDFLLSDAQQILSNRDYVPASIRIESPMRNMPLKFIDPVLSLDMNDKWHQSFDEVFVKRRN